MEGLEKIHYNQRKEEFRTKLGCDNLVISLRNFESVYDIETLLKAIPTVLNNFSNVKFILVGRGSQEAYLRQLANDLGVSNHVLFTGFIPSNEMPSYIASSDIYVSTALSDAGLAASTAEAMSCGLPAIVTDFGDNGQWVIENVGGYLFRPKAVSQLAIKILILLHNPLARRIMGKNNRTTITERNNWSVEMRKIELLYEDLTSKVHRSSQQDSPISFYSEFN